MNENIIKSSDMMMNVVNLVTNENSRIYSVWTNVVSKIKSPLDSDDCEAKMPIGERLAGNTRVIDLKNGVLLVETDHPGWIQYLRMYQNFILNGIKRAIPELNISSLAFRLAGSDYNLKETYDEQLEKAKTKMNEKLEKEEKLLNQIESEKKDKKESSLPPELNQIFESLKKTILTNSENK